MWIKTTLGDYINTDCVFQFRTTELKSGEVTIAAKTINNESYRHVAYFSTRGDAQLYLDRMMKIIAPNVFEVNMNDWNYTGHKKDQKETRRGGS